MTATRERRNGIPRIPEPREWLLTKVCSKCGERKPWALFSPHRYNEDGSIRRVQPYCRACHVKRHREHRRRWQKENWEHKLEYEREWRAKRAAALRAERFGWDRKLSGEPITLFLEGQLKRHETFAEIAGICQCDETTIRRLVKRQAKTVSLRQADRIITRLGFHLSDVYPQGED